MRGKNHRKSEAAKITGTFAKGRLGRVTETVEK